MPVIDDSGNIGFHEWEGGLPNGEYMGISRTTIPCRGTTRAGARGQTLETMPAVDTRFLSAARLQMAHGKDAPPRKR